MTQDLDPAVDHLIEQLEAIGDPRERDQVTRQLPAVLDVRLRDVRQRTALELRSQGLTYRQIGEVMGGVTAQRAEQIAKGGSVATDKGSSS
ncbi:hypothetical protein [Streptomyces sp. NPDC054784]